MTFKGESGLSLVETMISVGLLSLATGMMFLLFSGLSKQSDLQTKNMVTNQTASNFLTKLSRTYMGSEKIKTPKSRKLVLTQEDGSVTYETKCLKAKNKNYQMPEEMVRCVKCRKGSIPTVTLTKSTSKTKNIKTLSKQNSDNSPAASSICFYKEDAGEHRAVLDLHFPNRKNKFVSKKVLLVKNLNDEIQFTVGLK